MPVKDELREEEVLACVVLRQAAPDKAMADALVRKDLGLVRPDEVIVPLD